MKKPYVSIIVPAYNAELYLSECIVMKEKDNTSYPVHVVESIGGLGNQMFQYAFYLSLQQAYPNNKYYFDITNCFRFNRHNGYELNRVFGIITDDNLSDELAEKIKRQEPSEVNMVREKRDGCYQPVFNSEQPLTIYRGFWQTEKYFAHIAPLIRSTFRFDETKLSDASVSFLNRIRQQNAVSIHFRRGDYFRNYENNYLYGGICSIDYYRQAIQRMELLAEGKVLWYYLFSDDPAWVKENVSIPNCTVVDCNRGNDSWQDMCLMAACKHHIVANSSFSWWGAWLNNDENKVVIAPSPWLNLIDFPDLVPDKWIKIQMQEPVGRLNLLNTTFVIPVRIDSREREENLDVLLNYLNTIADTSVIILEADDVRRYTPKYTYANVTYLFVEDTDPVFHRTRYLNQLLACATTPVVGVWDTDVIVPALQIEKAVLEITEGRAVLAFPYDGMFYNVDSVRSELFREGSDINLMKLRMAGYPCMSLYSVGGAFLVNKVLYMQAGGENERFYGWGPEDVERVKRMEIFEQPIYRADGPLFHLHHPRGINSGYASSELEIKNRKELCTVCEMYGDELKEYISTWSWIKS